VDLIDETFIVAPLPAVAAAVHDRSWWARAWPGCELTVFQDRGDAGLRFTVAGALVGTSEVWLQRWGDGVIVHCYLRADLAGRDGRAARRSRSRRLARRTARTRTAQIKVAANGLKDALEAGRPPGLPRVTAAR
jgi:hypothetical protein